MGHFIESFSSRKAKGEYAPLQLDDIKQQQRKPFFWVTGDWDDMERGDSFYIEGTWHDYGNGF